MGIFTKLGNAIVESIERSGFTNAGRKSVMANNAFDAVVKSPHNNPVLKEYATMVGELKQEERINKKHFKDTYSNAINSLTGADRNKTELLLQQADELGSEYHKQLSPLRNNLKESQASYDNHVNQYRNKLLGLDEGEMVSQDRDALKQAFDNHKAVYDDFVNTNRSKYTLDVSNEPQHIKNTYGTIRDLQEKAGDLLGLAPDERRIGYLTHYFNPYYVEDKAGNIVQTFETSKEASAFFNRNKNNPELNLNQDKAWVNNS